MHINFAMWRKASWQLIKMNDKKEWDSLRGMLSRLSRSRQAASPRHINISDFQPGGFGSFQNSEPDFSFRGEGCILIVNPDDQTERGVRAHGRLKHKCLVYLEGDPILAPIEPVAVPSSHIHAEADSILADHLSH